MYCDMRPRDLVEALERSLEARKWCREYLDAESDEEAAEARKGLIEALKKEDIYLRLLGIVPPKKNEKNVM